MKANWFAAPKHLKNVLCGIWTLESNSDKALTARILPDGTPYIVIQRDGTQLKSSDNAGQRWSKCSVSGPRSTHFDIELVRGQIFIVQLSSAGGLPVLKLPMTEITDRCEELGNVITQQHQIRELSDKIMNSTHEANSVRVLEDWIVDRISTQKVCRADQLVNTVRDQCGTCSVTELAKKTNLSRRHLARIVKHEVGLSPKLFNRVIRFDHAVQLSRIRPNISLAHIADRAGYADQAHMTREFGQLGGIRPSDLQKEIGSMIW